MILIFIATVMKYGESTPDANHEEVIVVNDPAPVQVMDKISPEELSGAKSMHLSKMKDVVKYPRTRTNFSIIRSLPEKGMYICMTDYHRTFYLFDTSRHYYEDDQLCERLVQMEAVARMEKLSKRLYIPATAYLKMCEENWNDSPYIREVWVEKYREVILKERWLDRERIRLEKEKIAKEKKELAKNLYGRGYKFHLNRSLDSLKKESLRRLFIEQKSLSQEIEARNNILRREVDARKESKQETETLEIKKVKKHKVKSSKSRIFYSLKDLLRTFDNDKIPVPGENFSSYHTIAIRNHLNNLTGDIISRRFVVNHVMRQSNGNGGVVVWFDGSYSEQDKMPKVELHKGAYIRFGLVGTFPSSTMAYFIKNKGKSIRMKAKIVKVGKISGGSFCKCNIHLGN